MKQFPDNFVWGAASAAVQVEGAVAEDGRGPSIWDVFAHTPGKVWRDHHFDTASDQYHRYKEDVAHMKELGLNAYRFSIGWPRVLPEGVGTVNAKGLDYYDRLVDALLGANIAPFVTLYHWDLPYALHLRGGWLNPSSPDWFAEYAAVVVEKLGDRVGHWMTFNEPQCFVGLGYELGQHAPGYKLLESEFLRIAHHVLLAHGKGVQALRAGSAKDTAVGFAPHGVFKIPVSGQAADVEAARKSMFTYDKITSWSNTGWFDPIYLGRYPEDMLEVCGDKMALVRAEDMKIIHQPLDFFGINIYAGIYVRAGEDGAPVEVQWPPETPLTAFNWVVTPEVMYWGVKFLFERYGLPIYVTENGASCNDWPSLDGKVHDPQRIDFVARHLRELARAMDDGADVRGYFHWSIVDNFEWAEGYKERLGLIYVNLETGERFWKDSAYWYKNLIAGNGATVFES
ncbi:MAG TPA: beta-glucosidase [Candidatus Hydrogenedentes bacterium]|nr:beta-glucosidase [Candidatus Hydrogenedentota bacterium]